MFFQSAKRRDRQDDDRRRGRVASEGEGEGEGQDQDQSKGKALYWPRPTVRAWLPAALAPAGGPQGPAASVTASAVDELRTGIGTAALAFRGYDQTNLGRSPELLAHPVYGPIVRGVLDQASQIAAAAVGRPIDLAARIEAQEVSTLECFAEDVATIVAMELAQLAILEQVFEVNVREARLSFGYSIGEMSAMVNGGVYTMEQLLPIPLAFAADCAAMAADTTMGILFSRGSILHAGDVVRLCTAVSSQGRGLIGPSAYLSPNTVLVIGQGDTLDRLEPLMGEFLPARTNLRRKPNHWPPLHTPLVWQKNIPNRTAMALYQTAGGLQRPRPTVLSCVTGAASYDELNSRDLLTRWVDHPQRLWDVIYETLGSGIDLVVHVGPAPNLVPATFERLSNNVLKQMGNRYVRALGRGVVSSLNQHAWLARLLPSKAALLRAPFIAHIILEDWLLAQPVQEKAWAGAGPHRGPTA
jgi:[acyl-carrier-protein] S-malonyltransferase